MTNQELDRLIAIHVYGNMCPDFPFSTELDYSFGVINRMREKGFRIELGQRKSGLWYSLVYDDRFDLEHPVIDDIINFAVDDIETPQLAICLVALKTLGVKI